MKLNIRRIYEKMGGLSLKFDDMRTVAGQFMVQSPQGAELRYL